MSTTSRSVGERFAPGSTVPRSRPAATEADDQPTRDLRPLLHRRSDLIRPRVLAADCVRENGRPGRGGGTSRRASTQPIRSRRLGLASTSRLLEQWREQYCEGRSSISVERWSESEPAERSAACARDHEQSDKSAATAAPCADSRRPRATGTSSGSGCSGSARRARSAPSRCPSGAPST